MRKRAFILVVFRKTGLQRENVVFRKAKIALGDISETTVYVTFKCNFILQKCLEFKCISIYLQITFESPYEVLINTFLYFETYILLRTLTFESSNTMMIIIQTDSEKAKKTYFFIIFLSFCNRHQTKERKRAPWKKYVDEKSRKCFGKQVLLRKLMHVFSLSFFLSLQQTFLDTGKKDRKKEPLRNKICFFLLRFLFFPADFYLWNDCSSNKSTSEDVFLIFRILVLLVHLFYGKAWKHILNARLISGNQ